MYDVIIVGGGPAGLAAALSLGRMRRRTLLLDSGEPRNAPADAMHNVLSRDGTPPGEFRRIAREQLAPYGTVEIRDMPVTNAERHPEGRFDARLADGSTVRARRLLLATGMIDELPPIEGLPELWGRGVFHCPYCHGYEVRDTPLAVLGGTSMAAHLSLHLRQLSDDVVLCTHGPADLDPELTATLAAQDVSIHETPVARVEGRDRHLERIVFEDGEALERHALFCTIAPLRQRSDLPQQLGCRMLPDRCVEVDMLGRTSVPGVFAAGDLARRADVGQMASVISAAANGTLAGAATDKDLVLEDVRLLSATTLAAQNGR